MRVHETDIQKLGVLLTPTFMRKPVVAALVKTLLRPLESLNYRRRLFRRHNMDTLHCTGQVWSIEKMLNDTFDNAPGCRRFRVVDEVSVGQWLIVHSETATNETQVVVGDEREGDAGHIIVHSTDTIFATKNFTVLCPPELFFQKETMTMVAARVNHYKLPGTKPAYEELAENNN